MPHISTDSFIALIVKSKTTVTAKKVLTSLLLSNTGQNDTEGLTCFHQFWHFIFINYKALEHA